MLTVRPRVAELVFQCFSRALHPELFETHSLQTVERGDYQAAIAITGTGHVVTWRYRGLTLTEIATSTGTPLPQKRRLVSYRVRGQRSDCVECRGGARYRVNVELEKVEPEIFWAFQQELSLDGERQGLLHRFHSNGRLALGAISYVYFETRQRSLSVQAFHTFPDDYAIVKTQTLFETP